MFFNFYKKNIIKNMHKNTKLQTFPTATFLRHYTRKGYLTTGHCRVQHIVTVPPSTENISV